MSNNNIRLYQLRTAEAANSFLNSDRQVTEMYQAFMTGYVRRINEATFKVTIGGVRIGTAKYSRLAQINLKSRIITFSRYAIENVPERGRRYLVIHELAHVTEPSHNQKFWRLVENFEPNFKQVGKALELAFRRNVAEDQMQREKVKLANPVSGRMEEPKLLLSTRLMNYGIASKTAAQLSGDELDFNPGIEEDSFECLDDEFGMFDASRYGIIHGGSTTVQSL
ncbi:MAG TPA: M48 family metallopeptidase [Candidatus Obscuribacterales bacterium]